MAVMEMEHGVTGNKALCTRYVDGKKEKNLDSQKIRRQMSLLHIKNQIKLSENKENQVMCI